MGREISLHAAHGECSAGLVSRRRRDVKVGVDGAPAQLVVRHHERCVVREKLDRLAIVVKLNPLGRQHGVDLRDVVSRRVDVELPRRQAAQGDASGRPAPRVGRSCRGGPVIDRFQLFGYSSRCATT